MDVHVLITCMCWFVCIIDAATNKILIFIILIKYSRLDSLNIDSYTAIFVKLIHLQVSATVNAYQYQQLGRLETKNQRGLRAGSISARKRL